MHRSCKAKEPGKGMFFFDACRLLFMAVVAYIPLVAILLGIVNTILLHLAKSMERQGIEIFDQIRAALKKEQIAGTIKEKLKKPVIYIVGVILNNLPPVWALLASLFGPPSLYTSMFGVGLIALLVYSRNVLKEEFHRVEIYGAISIVIGTFIIGIEGIFRTEQDMKGVNILGAVIASAVFISFGLVLMAVSFKRGTRFLGFAFGLAAGGVGAIDPFFKALYTANSLGLANFLALGLSFVFGFLAFAITQWGFARKAQANILVPAYNSTYILIPVIFQALLLPGFDIYISTIIGLALITLGIVLMRAFKPETGSSAGGNVNENSRNPESEFASLDET